MMAWTMAMERLNRSKGRPPGYKSPVKNKRLLTTRKRLYQYPAKVIMAATQEKLNLHRNRTLKPPEPPFKIPKVKKFIWNEIIMFNPDPDQLIQFQVS
jgi:hypothetical protein